MNTDKIINELFQVLAIAEINCISDDISIEVLTAPHTPPKNIPENKMAVYSFFYSGKALKVGKAGPKSKARYTSQHYNAGSAPSTLAASLERKPEILGLAKAQIGNSKEWLLQNTDRINFIINKRLGVDTLNLIEAFLIAKLKPAYEGFEGQQRYSES